MTFQRIIVAGRGETSEKESGREASEEQTAGGQGGDPGQDHGQDIILPSAEDLAWKGSAVVDFGEEAEKERR